jgi:hypothetical protein
MVRLYRPAAGNPFDGARTMNIFRLSFQSGIPLRKLRLLDKLGALRVDPNPEFIDGLIFHMRGNRNLTVAQLLALIDDPAALDDLGAARPRYASRAREQLAALGDIVPQAAPREVTAAIQGASRGDDDESLIIATWLKSVLPVEPVSHAWITVRLLFPLNAFMREQTAPLISPALLNMRKLPEFAGYWQSEKIGARSTIKYFRTRGEISLDL